MHILEAYQRPRGRGMKARWARRDVYWENMWCDLLLSFRELKIGKKKVRAKSMLHYTKKNEMWQPRYVHPSSKKCLGILRCAPPFLAKIGSSHVFAQTPWGKKSARIQVVILSIQYVALHYNTLHYGRYITVQHNWLDWIRLDSYITLHCIACRCITLV